MASNERFNVGDLVMWHTKQRSHEGHVVYVTRNGSVVVRRADGTCIRLRPNRLAVIETAADRPPWE